jgi:hypothetical protein
MGRITSPTRLALLMTFVGLVFAFGAGMAAVLVVVGSVAWKLESATVGLDGAPIWQLRLAILCGAILSTIGLWLFFQ